MTVREDEIKQSIKGILETISVIKIEIVEKILVNRYSPNINTVYVDMVLRKMQASNQLLLSSDGYVMTRGAYVRVSGDIFYSDLKIGYIEKVKSGLDYSHSRDGTNVIPCMYIYADLQPYTQYLVKGRDGWDLSFITLEHDDKPSRLYSVAYFARGYESVKAELLLMSEKGYEHVEKDRVRRIAIFEDEEMAFLAPKSIGITAVVCIDEDEQSGFRIIKSIPASDAW